MDLNSQRLTLELSTNLSQSFRQATPLDPMLLFLIWGLFGKILAAQLHHQFQDKSPVYCNGWKTYPFALDLFCKRAKQLLPYPDKQQASFSTLQIVPGSQTRECFLTFV